MASVEGLVFGAVALLKGGGYAPHSAPNCICLGPRFGIYLLEGHLGMLRLIYAQNPYLEQGPRGENLLTEGVGWVTSSAGFGAGNVMSNVPVPVERGLKGHGTRLGQCQPFIRRGAAPLRTRNLRAR